MKKFLLTVLSFILVFMAGILNAAFAENFYIENYDVLINVEKDAVLDIKETIDVNFTTPSHGIIRRIPFRYNQQYPDGRKLHRVARLKNVKVSERFGSHYDNSDYVIKIGDPDVLVSGQHSYEISYKYVNQKDPFEGYDELYHNVIGIGWGVPINNASFKINMPEQFDNSKIGVSIGKHGKPGFSGDADIYANKMSVWGQTLRTLSPHEGITVRIELPDNYFESSGKSDAGLRYMTLTIIAVCVFIAFIVWFIYGKDEPVIPIINFYPPENKNSAEIGAEFKGSAYDKCVVSLIIYLASKGYISIRDDDSSFEFVKLKEYDGTNSIERKMMQILFCDDDTVSESELEESPVFYRECEKLMQELTKKTKKSIFDPKACTPGKVILLIACTVGILVSVLYALTSYSFSSLTALVQSQENLVMSILVILGTIVVIPAVIGKRSASLYAFWALWYTGFSGIPLVMLFTENQHLFLSPDFLVAGVGTIALIISFICLVNLPKRNYYGRMALGNILGFRKFIVTAQTGEMENLLRENPQYCYEIIPYAYVLGVSDTWIKKFETIMREAPEWYVGSFSHRRFDLFANRMVTLSGPTTANGGIVRHHSGGGGGYSGGGGGGGGGSSW